MSIKKIFLIRKLKINKLNNYLHNNLNTLTHREAKLNTLKLSYFFYIRQNQKMNLYLRQKLFYAEFKFYLAMKMIFSLSKKNKIIIKLKIIKMLNI
ncbi:hypothetical protein BpHYR1_054044 [Brachionus plicatilis]|uniref:Uncharacterized protein n=1 Tax=Brachionus plicatilis TaxID=10195 RepID=A0A3M7RA07_BRAPC|nr:hypothetical protein BpHYR1_054044 [Brachionus plicatilis]